MRSTQDLGQTKSWLTFVPMCLKISAKFFQDVGYFILFMCFFFGSFLSLSLSAVGNFQTENISSKNRIGFCVAMAYGLFESECEISVKRDLKKPVNWFENTLIRQQVF